MRSLISESTGDLHEELYPSFFRSADAGYDHEYYIERCTQ